MQTGMQERRGLAVAVAMALALGTAPARAEEPAVPEAAPAGASDVRGGRWYGWQVLLSDAAVFGLYGVAAKEGDGGPAVIGTAGFLVGAPLVHAANHQRANTCWSLGLRLAMPVAGFLVGLAYGAGEPDRGTIPASLVYGPIYALGGMAAASVIDVLFVSYERGGEAPLSPAAPASSPAASWAPGVTLARDARRALTPVLAVGGTF
jgi:hypothetical protein